MNTTATYRAARTASAGTVLLTWLALAAVLVTLAITPARSWAAATCATPEAAASPAYSAACDALAERGW